MKSDRSEGCCHKTRLVGAPCPVGQSCPHDARPAPVEYVQSNGAPAVDPKWTYRDALDTVGYRSPSAPHADITAKPSNPKDLIGSTKLPLHLWPTTATAMGCVALVNGALKYGRANWRVAGVRASIYKDAAARHLDAWFEGEETDPDDGVPHLAAALACLAIIVDAQAAGKLTDDRQVKGGYRGLMDSLTPHVTRLKELHAGKSPRHYTVADNG